MKARTACADSLISPNRRGSLVLMILTPVPRGKGFDRLEAAGIEIERDALRGGTRWPCRLVTRTKAGRM
jgi:hypothetical protein